MKSEWETEAHTVVPEDENRERAVVKFILYAALLFMASIVAGCTGKLTHQNPADDAWRTVTTEQAETAKILDRHFNKWAGTPYREGGVDKRGLDCSGFVQQAYYTLFSISLPRTTKTQAKSGNKITRSELKPTDLVFFKTGLFNKHVGIYRGNGRFMHVSTKRGVTLSPLNDGYWNDHFWQARRIIN